MFAHDSRGPTPRYLALYVYDPNDLKAPLIMAHEFAKREQTEWRRIRTPEELTDDDRRRIIDNGTNMRGVCHAMSTIGGMMRPQVITKKGKEKTAVDFGSPIRVRSFTTSVGKVSTEQDYVAQCVELNVGDSLEPELCMIVLIHPDCIEQSKSMACNLATSFVVGSISVQDKKLNTDNLVTSASTEYLYSWINASS